jgi:hypothetical protein
VHEIDFKIIKIYDIFTERDNIGIEIDMPPVIWHEDDIGRCPSLNRSREYREEVFV